MKRTAKLGIAAVCLSATTVLADTISHFVRDVDEIYRIRTIVDRNAVGGVIDEDGNTGLTTATWPDYRCQQVTNCPTGMVRRGDQSYAGCTKLFGGCVGSCQQCTGSTADGYLCVEDEGESCFMAPGFSTMNCGTITYIPDCYYSASPPAGEPFATPNKCYCSTTSTPSPSTTPCTVTQCG